MVEDMVYFEKNLRIPKSASREALLEIREATIYYIGPLIGKHLFTYIAFLFFIHDFKHIDSSFTAIGRGQKSLIVSSNLT